LREKSAFDYEGTEVGRDEAAQEKILAYAFGAPAASAPAGTA